MFVIEPGTKGTGPDLWLLHGSVAMIESGVYPKQADDSSWLILVEDLRKHTPKTSAPQVSGADVIGCLDRIQFTARLKKNER